MSDTVTARADAPPPEAQIAQILLGQLVPRLAYLFATLKLADHLSAGPKSAEELASVTGTHAPTLARVLRTLASLGFVTQDGQHRFALQPLGAVLKSGTPSYAAALILGGEICTRSLDHLLHSVQTGKTGFERLYGKPMFDWLGEHPTQASLFNDTMVGFHGMEPAAVAAAYDFSKMKTVADVGGSTGNMIATILSKYPEPRGILFDLPHVVAEAPAISQATRCGRSGPHRRRQLLRWCSCWRRRLRPVARHPRLERGAVPDDSRSLPPCDGSQRPPAAGGDGAARG